MNIFKTSYHQFINQPPMNETQTRWTRFVKKPDGEINTMFSKSQQDFEVPKTRYSEYLEDYNAIF